MTTNDLFTRFNYLFGTNKQHRMRKFMILCREELVNTFREMKYRREVLTGSTSEGVWHPPSDGDTMFVYTSPEIQVQSSVEEAVQHNAPLMIPSDNSPGHCLLWIPDVYRHQAAHLCVFWIPLFFIMEGKIYPNRRIHPRSMYFLIL